MSGKKRESILSLWAQKGQPLKKLASSEEETVEEEFRKGDITGDNGGDHRGDSGRDSGTRKKESIYQLLLHIVYAQ